VFSSLQFRNYRRVFLYSSFNSAGGWAGLLATEWLVLDLTGSAAALGGMLGIQVAPIILISLVGGSFADRFSERNILLATSSLLIILYTLLYLTYKQGTLTFGTLALFSFALNTVGAIQGPVFTALSIKVVPEERVANAISLNSVTFNIGRLFGPLAAGLIIAASDTGTPFLYIAGLYLLVILVLTQIRMGELHQNASASASGNLREGFAYLSLHRALYLPMFIAGIFTGLGMNFSLISALMVRQVYQEDSRHLGFIGVLLAIGGLLGAGYVARLSVSGHKPKFSTMMLSGVSLALFWVAASVAPNFWIYAVLVIFVNFFHLVIMATANGIVAANAPLDLQGRVYGIYLFIFHLCLAIGAPIIGFLATGIGIRTTVGIGGSVVLLLSLLALSNGKNLKL
jgi:predicted MFS family arabinose efflux permease